jgi:hypothetical protein
MGARKNKSEGKETHNDVTPMMMAHGPPDKGGRTRPAKTQRKEAQTQTHNFLAGQPFSEDSVSPLTKKLVAQKFVPSKAGGWRAEQ